MSAGYDLVIAGGGIHGVGIAQAAAAAGHSVLLLEKTALASGSSSRSSKLIHGGLRYLESGQLRLVRESLHERTTLLRNAPELVRLQRFHIPVYHRTRRRSWQLRVGLSLYTALGGFARGTGFGTVPRSQWPQLDGLATDGLQTVFWYHDAQTDDAQLTRAVMHSAQQLGAELAQPARFVSATLSGDRVIVHYRDGETERECSAGVLVNAGGPWAEQLARSISPAISIPPLQMVQGTHIVLPGHPERGFYYVESPRDGRAIFVMPWHGQTLIGTTELPFHGDPDAVAPSAREEAYLLGVARHYFPKYRTADASTILASFAGLRVLPAGPGHAFHRSRETLLLTDRTHRPRVLSVYGGKLTTWRAVSERALQRLAGSLPQRMARARTDQLRLQAS